VLFRSIHGDPAELRAGTGHREQPRNEVALPCLGTGPGYRAWVQGLGTGTGGLPFCKSHTKDPQLHASCRIGWTMCRVRRKRVNPEFRWARKPPAEVSM